MADDGLQGVRSELIRLLENDEWKISGSAEKDGRKILQKYGGRPTPVAIIDFVKDLLASGSPFHEVGLGEPPGCNGTGYVINHSDDKVRDLYIKLKIENDEVWLLSFHLSKH